MAFPHRLDAPELPDFSMLKRLARDQLIYLLEQVGRCLPRLAPLLRQQCGPPCDFFLVESLGILLGASSGRSKMGYSTGNTEE
ncbi:hypothetical protein NN561_017950 [Cricetulus griseus]